jgi:2-methylisocitrate lyase-like PEP mutase family enzyme
VSAGVSFAAMNRDTQRQLATAFRRRHREGPIIVLPNAFDCASARIIARHSPLAIGTSSGATAWSAGYPDGERMRRHELLAAIGRIVGCVDIGVTADIEGGYGETAEDARAIASLVLDIGAIGVNLEDSQPAGPRAGELLDLEQAAAKVAATREAAEQAEVDLTINARTDVFLGGARQDDIEARSEAVRRGNAYLAAGADCVFVPGAVERALIKALVEGINGPVSLYALPGLPRQDELGQLGVRRVSVGSGFYQACLALTEDAVRELLHGSGDYAPFLDGQLSFTELQELLETGRKTLSS